MKDILFIGALDYPNIPRNGDSVKNQYLVDFFQKHRTIDCIDTWNWKTKPWIMIQILWSTLFGKYRSIVYSVSNKSAYKLTRLFTILPHHKKLIYFMIGGYTPIKIAQGIYKAEPFKKLDKIIVEADRVCDFYREVGINNTLRVYNFKPYSYIPDTNTHHKGIIKFVFLSRLTQLKGIFLILDAVHKLNGMGYKDRFQVDFFGSITVEVKDKFMTDMALCENTKYLGFLNLKEENNYSILANYDAMLFPTMHPTEGFPGVIADAAIAGLPVIASNWNYADELVNRNQVGYVIPVGDLDALVEQMRYVIENRLENEKLRSNCIAVAQKYKMSNVLTPELLIEIGL